MTGSNYISAGITAGTVYMMFYMPDWSNGYRVDGLIDLIPYAASAAIAYGIGLARRR